jgi:ferredoxin
VVEVSHKEGRQNKKFSLAKAVVEADGVISLPRFKTHALEKITGGVKNQFGCVPGFLKAEFHAKLTNAAEFGRMLVDLTNLVRPRLYILDAVYAMEGNGPRSGNLRKMNLLMLSEDPVALDATACRLIDVDPTLIPTIVYGQEFGCGTFQKEEIQLEGDSFEEFFCPEFDVDRGPIEKYVSGSGSKLAVVLLAIVKTKVGNRLFHKLLITKPVIDAAKCVKCGICVQICPTHPKSVDWIEGDKSRPPRHDYERCIRCFCCQETCPEGAIYVKKPLLRKIVADY